MTIPTPYPDSPDWPTDWQGCLLTGQFVWFDGSPLAGKTITLSPSPVAMLDYAGRRTIVSKPLEVTLGPHGQVQGFDGLAATVGVDVPGSNDPDINPNGFTYMVAQNWPGGQTYPISAPINEAVDLTLATPVPSSNGVPVTRGPSGLPLGSVPPPASSTAAGTPGQLAYDGSYLYTCTAPNTWVRAALTTW